MKSCKPHEKTKQKTSKTSIGEKLKTKSLMFFVSFFSCDLQDFKFWYVNRKAFGARFLYWVDFIILYPLNEKQVQNWIEAFLAKTTFSIASLEIHVSFWQALISSAVWKLMSVFKVSMFPFLSRISCHQTWFFKNLFELMK